MATAHTLARALLLLAVSQLGKLAFLAWAELSGEAAFAESESLRVSMEISCGRQAQPVNECPRQQSACLLCAVNSRAPRGHSALASVGRCAPVSVKLEEPHAPARAREETRRAGARPLHSRTWSEGSDTSAWCRGVRVGVRGVWQPHACHPHRGAAAGGGRTPSQCFRRCDGR
jgi:hypothetical protein